MKNVEQLIKASQVLNGHGRTLLKQSQMLMNLARETARRSAELVIEANGFLDAADELMDRAEAIILLHDPPEHCSKSCD
jgi:hypothetical protein